MAQEGGQPGNCNAAKDRPFRQALLYALAQAGDGDSQVALRKIAARLVKRATEGEPDACKEIADRTDGKPAQAIVGSSDSEPIQIVITPVQAAL